MKTRQKRPFLGSLLVFSAFTSTMAGATGKTAPAASVAAPGGQAIGGVGLPVIVARPPGFYEEIKINDKAFVQIYDQLDKDDSDYIKATVLQMDQALKDLYSNQLKRVLELENKGLGNPNGVDLQEYLRLTADLKVALATASALIENTMLVPSLRKTDGKVDLNTGKISIQTQGRMKTVDFTPLLSSLNTKLKSLEAQINNIEIFVNSPQKGGRIAQKIGAVLDQSLLAAFTPAQINAFREEAEAITTNARNLFRMGPMRQVNDANRSIVISFIKTYGMNDRFRLQTDDVGFQKSLRMVEDIFIVRSLMRYRYGVPLGAFGTPDTRRKFHLNLLPRMGDNELKLDEQTYYTLEEMIAKRRAIVEIFNTQDMRSKNPLTLDTNIGLFARLSSAANLLRGSLTYSECNAFVLNLMLNDIDEEMMVTEIGGVALLKANIQKRLIANAKDQTELDRYKAIMNAGNIATGELDRSNAIDASGSFSTARIIADASTRYQTHMQQANAKRHQAASLEKDFNAYSNMNNQRVDDLFNR